MYRTPLLSALIVLFVATVAHGEIRYVDQANTGPQDGTSWSTAFTGTISGRTLSSTGGRQSVQWFCPTTFSAAGARKRTSGSA